MSDDITIRKADYSNRTDQVNLIRLLDMYASDPMGGGTPLAGDVKARLCDVLADCPTAFTLLAYNGDRAVGLANCFESVATFDAKPMVNLHDLAVDPSYRGRGVARLLLEAVETEARRRGCGRLTLEVLSGNTRAKGIYEQFGFTNYVLDETTGHALFMKKALAY